MTGLIRHQVASTIFRVSIVRQPAVPQGTEGHGEDEGVASADGAQGSPAGGANPPGALARAGTGAKPLPKPLPQGRATGGASGVGDELRPGFSPSGVRMGRNDQCWCGSGLKYKKCHGRS
jgi:preprotein translocase subunit SecA